MAKKISPMTDIKSLPKWQKYTIIAILFMLALAFTMSGAMVAVINAVTQKSGLPMGKIGGTSIEYEDFENYYMFYSTMYSLSESGQGSGAKQLLFSKMPVKSATGELQTFIDTYYIDSVANDVKNTSEEQEKNKLYSLVVDKLAWNHLLLLRLAEEKDIVVSDDNVREISREILLGPPNKPTLPDPSTAINAPAEPNTEEDPDKEIKDQRDLSKLWQEELDMREAKYADSLESLFSTNQQYVMSPELFEKIVKECLIIKRYMDLVISGNVNITRKDILENIDSMKNEMMIEYLRVKSDDPEVIKRAKEKLSDELAMIALKREVWESGTFMSSTELFSDPLQKIFDSKLESDTDRFDDPEYRLGVIGAEFKDLGSFVNIPDEILKQFYDHYKKVFFRNDREETDINKQIDDEKKQLIKDHEKDQPKGENGEIKKWEPVEGWDKWRENRVNELSYKPFDNVKPEVNKLAREMATPKYAAAAIKKLSEIIKKRIEKNREANEKIKQSKQHTLDSLKQLEAIVYDSDFKDGAIKLISNFKAKVISEIEKIYQSCSLNFDEDSNAALTKIDLEVISDALLKAWHEIDTERSLLLVNLKFTENPYDTDSNQIADVKREISSLSREIDRIKNSQHVEDFMRLEEIEQNAVIANQKLDLLMKLRTELMTTLNEIKNAFRQAILLSESFENNFSVSKGFLDTYFDNFNNQISKIFNGFDERLNIEKIGNEIQSQVQNLEIDLKRFETESEERAKNLSKELPPDALLNLKIEDFPYRNLGLKVHDIEISKVYRGLTIKGLWGAGISPYEFISTLSVDDMKNDPWLKKNMPYLLNARKWDFATNTSSGNTFEDIIKDLNVGEYSEPIGVPGVGVYIIYLAEKIDDQQPEFDDVKEEIVQDYIDQNISEIAKEYAQEIRSEIVDAFNEILDANPDALLDVAKKYIDDETIINDLKTKYGKADPTNIIKFKKLIAEHTFANFAKKYNLELKQTDYVNVESDVEDIAYDSDSDKAFLNSCMLLAPYFELSDIAKEVRPDEERNTKTNASYIFARVIGTRKPTLTGSNVDPSDIVEEEIDLLYKNLWAQKILASNAIMDLTNTGKLINLLEKEGVKVKVYKEKLSDASPNRQR